MIGVKTNSITMPISSSELPIREGERNSCPNMNAEAANGRCLEAVLWS